METMAFRLGLKLQFIDTKVDQCQQRDGGFCNFSGEYWGWRWLDDLTSEGADDDKCRACCMLLLRWIAAS